MVNILYKGCHLQTFALTGSIPEDRCFTLYFHNRYSEIILEICVDINKQTVVLLAGGSASATPEVKNLTEFSVQDEFKLEFFFENDAAYIRNEAGSVLCSRFVLSYNSIYYISSTNKTCRIHYKNSDKHEYFSCEYISSGMALQGKQFSFCCFTQKEDTRLPIQPDLAITADNFSFDSLVKKRAEYVALLNSEEAASSPCHNCPMLVKRSWPGDAVQIDRITLNHFSLCNCKCTYCYTQRPGFTHISRPHLHFGKILQALAQQDAFFPICKVMWGGGEVTLLEEFEGTFHSIAKLGMHQHINTNAMLYSQSIYDGLRNKAATACISLDSSSREMYHKVKGVDAFQAVIESIRKYAVANYLAGGWQLFLKYILFDPNATQHEIDTFVDICSYFSINHVVLSACEGYYAKNVQANPEEILVQARYFYAKTLERKLRCTFTGFGGQELRFIKDS